MEWRQMSAVRIPWRGRRTPFVTRMKRVLYCRIEKVLSRYGVRPRPLRVEDYLGAPLPEVLDHLQRQFTEANGYTWLNFGRVWHIDHKDPVGRANQSIDDVIRKLHYTNLQPFDRVKNVAKAANPEGGQERRLFRRGWFT